MRTILLAVPLLVLGLAACEPYPQNSGYPGYPEPYPQGPQGYPPYPPGPVYPAPGYPTGQINYRANGTEPFWNLEIGQSLTFSDYGNNVVVQPTPQPINATAGEIYRTQRIEVNIVHSRCSDGMSDRIYPDTVQVYVDGQQYRGCGALIAFFSQVGETGQPNYPAPGTPGAMMLSGTNWRVTAINGRPAPPSNYYLNFMPDRINAKFGCNLFFGGYVQRGNILIADGMEWTRRAACPDMSFENQGSAVLEQPMTISGVGNHLTLSNRSGSIDLVRAD